jgi:hypothetical protein
MAIKFRANLPTDTHAKHSSIDAALAEIREKGQGRWGLLPTTYKTRKSAHSTATWLRRTRKGWKFKVIGTEIWARKHRSGIPR